MKSARANTERGIVLGMAIVTAVIFSIAAYAMLMVAMNQRQRIKGFDVDRLRARYAAEAGLVWAHENLWSDPDFCPGPPPHLNINSLDVTVTVAPCGAGTTQHKVTASITY